MDKAIVDGSVDILREGETHELVSSQEDAQCCAEYDHDDIYTWSLKAACEIKVLTFDGGIVLDIDSRKCSKRIENLEYIDIDADF